MEYLRWILLAAGILFVLIVYLVGRKTKQQNTSYDYEEDGDAPEFSAQQWNENDEEYVGDVHIVARDNIADEVSHDIYMEDSEDFEVNQSSPISDSVDNIKTEEPDNDNESESVVVLHIMARPPERLAGDKVNSIAQANNLRFGNMNIFHRFDTNARPMFSMANMVEPGDFDPEMMHELKTPGLVMFMQQSSSVNNLDVFEDMLECAYHMSEMLGANLCNRQRQPMTQSDAEQYRKLVTGFGS